jgi:outer membrane murein-binding lipoprotein Lpp
MAFGVEDFQDLIRLLGEHPEWRTELRRHVLSDELLELPAIVQRVEVQLGTLTEQVGTLAVRMDQLTERVDALAARMDQLTERVDALASQMEQLTERVDTLAARMDQLTERVDRLVVVQTRMEERLAEVGDRLGTLEGDMLELRYERRAMAYFAPLATKLRVVDSSTLADQLDEAMENGRLNEGERLSVLAADLVLTGRRRPDGEPIYLLAEVSVGIGPHDVERALERARLLERLGRAVLPVVAGRSITTEARALAEQEGVRQVLNGRTTVRD